MGATVAGIQPNYYQSKNLPLSRSGPNILRLSNYRPQLAQVAGALLGAGSGGGDGLVGQGAAGVAGGPLSGWAVQGLVELVRALQGGSVAAWKEPNQCRQPPRPPLASVSLEPGGGVANHPLLWEGAKHQTDAPMTIK